MKPTWLASLKWHSIFLSSKGLGRRLIRLQFLVHTMQNLEVLEQVSSSVDETDQVQRLASLQRIARAVYPQASRGAARKIRTMEHLKSITMGPPFCRNFRRL